ncbi:helix-turn-helix domain-containing protein [Paenibacillus doosanensis]|uniref:helix-turn-helix domain-containing protein n=1 Tax=Paenibacillus doosanensis TaxID=1229154 RepID=UPI00217F2BB8|nr:helix-turn-helix domain-containing protein [Paenibacillus doosanensis]MCS7458671.1 helix-turn-helix domain-containing protein [Paenibacillus doosanensis]
MLTLWIQRIWTFGPVRLKVIMTACLLAVVPIAILGTVTYMLASHSLFQEIGQANQETVKQVQERIDDKLINLDKVVLQHAFNPVFKEFLSQENPYGDPQLFSSVMAILNSMEGLINDSDGVYLYMTRQNLIVSPSQGLAEASRLHPSVLEAIRSHKEAFFWIDRKRSQPTVTRGGSHVVTLVRKLPASVVDKPLGFLVIELNDRAFFDVFTHMQFGRSGEMIIVTPSGNILSDWNKQLLQPDSDDPVIRRIAAASRDEEMFTLPIGQQDILFNYLKSDYNGWRYLSAVPLKELTSSIQWIKNATLAVSSLLVLICVIAAVTLSGSFLRVLQGILDMVRKRGGTLSPPPHATKNEFSLLRHYMESLHSANRHLELQMTESLPLLRASFLQRLVTEPMQPDEIEEKLRYYGIDMPAPYCTVMCLELDHLRGHTERDLHLFSYAAVNIAKELLSRCAHGFVFQTQTDDITVVLNHGSDEASTHELQTAAFSLAEELRSVIQSVLKITVTAGIGRCYQGSSQIKLSHKEAQEALQYQMIHGSGNVFYIGAVSPQAASYEYPIEQEQLILTGVKLGQLEQVCDQLDEFAARLTNASGGANYDHVQQAFVQLIAASLKTLYELDPEEGPKVLHYNAYHRLGRMKTSEAIVKWLKEELYPALLQHITQRRSLRQRHTMEKVLNYIHEHYQEDLTQPLLAELASMPTSQFSHLFKVETSMTLTDYIIAFRMEKAKEWLRESDCKVAEIADRLRYNNPQNFIRSFKRLCGMTPGEYRSKYSSKQQAAATAEG